MAKTKPQKPKRRQATIYFEESVLKRLKMYGVLIDKDISDLVHDAVNEYLDKNKAPGVPSGFLDT